MAATFEIRAETSNLKAIAAVNGRVRVSVSVYTKDDGPRVLRTDSIDPIKAAERQGYASALPPEFQEEGLDLLDQLASLITAESIRKPTPSKEPDPFGEIEPWPDPVNGGTLLDEIRAFLVAYVVLPPFAADALAVWLVHSYLLDVADYTPYPLVTSPVRECGKSTLLEILGQLAYRAKKTDGITAAALYRVIEKYRPTMLLDELDTRLRGDSGELLRGVLNSGFERGGNITICVGDEHDTKEFSTFCPKVLAGIGRVWDTVASRSIPIRLNRATKPELATLRKIRGDRIGAVCLPVRRQIVRWTSAIRDDVRDADPAMPDSLSARQCDVWRPLLAIADAAGPAWGATARAAAVALHGVAVAEGDIGLQLLEDLRAIFAELGTTVVPSARIVAELVKREDRPWPEYRDGKPISATTVAKILGRFEVRPRTKRDGPTTFKGYELAALAPVFEKYLREQSPSDATGVTGVTGNSDGGGAVLPADRGEAWEPEPDDDKELALNEAIAMEDD